MELFEYCFASPSERYTPCSTPGPLKGPLLGGFPGSSLLIGQQATSLQLTQLKARLALTQLSNALAFGSQGTTFATNSKKPVPYISATPPSPTAAAINLLNLLKIANTMSHPPYNPYAPGKRNPSQGVYGLSNIPMERDPRGLPSFPGPGSNLSPSGASSVNSRPVIPSLMSLPISYRPEQSRSEVEEDIASSVDMHISRAREEVRFLGRSINQHMDQDSHFPSTHREEFRSSGTEMDTKSSAPVSRGDRQNLETQSDSRSFDWSSNYRRSTEDVSRFNMPPPFPSSISSDDVPHERQHDTTSIPGLGDYDYPVSHEIAAPTRSSKPKYTYETASQILKQFGIDKDDLQHLAAFTEDQITPANLPFILRQIRILKDKKATSVHSESFPESHSVRAVSEGDNYGSFRTGGAVMHQEKTSSVLQSSKVIDYGHTGKYTAGVGLDFGRVGDGDSSGRTGNMLAMDSATSRYKPQSLDKSIAEWKSSAFGSSREQVSYISPSPSCSFAFSSAPSQSSDQAQRMMTQLIDMPSLLPLQKKDIDIRGLDSEAFKPAPLKQPETAHQSTLKPQQPFAWPHEMKPTHPGLMLVGSNEASGTKEPVKTQRTVVVEHIIRKQITEKEKPIQPKRMHETLKQQMEQKKTQQQTEQKKTPQQTEQKKTPQQMEQKKTQQQMEQKKTLQQTEQRKTLQQTEQKKTPQQTEQKKTQQQTEQKNTQQTAQKKTYLTWKTEQKKTLQTPEQQKQGKPQKPTEQTQAQPAVKKETQPVPRTGQTKSSPASSAQTFVPLVPHPLIPGHSHPLVKPPFLPQPTTGLVTYNHLARVTPNTQSSAKVPVSKDQPTQAMINDYAANPPGLFPHTCSLCAKTCTNMQDWISHQNNGLHLEKCKNLRRQYPKWNAELDIVSSTAGKDVKPSSKTSKKTSRHERTRHDSRSRSKSKSPRHHRGSAGGRDKQRSRSRSPRHSRYHHRTRSRSRSWSRSRSRSPWHDHRISSRYRSRSRSPDRQSSTRHRDRRRSTPTRSHERRTSPRRKRERRLSRDSESSPEQERRRSTERLAKKLLERSGVQSLSDQSDLEAVVKSLAPALVAELSKMKSSSSSGKGRKRSSSPPSDGRKRSPSTASSSSSASKKESATNVSKEKNSQQEEESDKESSSTIVKLNGVPKSVSHSKLLTAVEQFGRTKSVVMFRARMEAIVTFEDEESAKKIKTSNRLYVEGVPVIIVDGEENVFKEQNRHHQKSVVSSASSAESTSEKAPSSSMSKSEKVVVSEAMNVSSEQTAKTLESGTLADSKEKSTPTVKKPLTTVTAEDDTLLTYGERINEVLLKRKIQSLTAQESQRRDRNLKLDLQIGHKICQRKSEGSDDVTYDCTVFLRGPPMGNIENIVDNVVFELEDVKIKRAFQKPPYEVTHSGPALTTVHIHLHSKNRGFPRGKSFKYGIPLGAEGEGVRHVSLTFKDPSEKFRQQLIEAGADAALPGSSPHSSADKNNRRLLILSELPPYNNGCYTEEDIANLLVPFGFRYTEDSMYVIPHVHMAFFLMNNAKQAQKMMETAQKCPLVLQGAKMCVKEVINMGMTPLDFYTSLMGLAEFPVEDNGTRTILIKNISQSETKDLREALKKIGSVRNFLPLLNKVYVEFDSDQDADRLGVWYSFQKRNTDHRVFRLKAPTSDCMPQAPRLPEAALPDKDVFEGVTVPPTDKEIPLSSTAPFWVSLRNKPYVFPTVAPWFNIPEYQTINDMADMERVKDSNSTTIMLTGLPREHYEHKDVARLVLPYFTKKTLHSLCYNVTVLPLQRRAFVFFSDWATCCSFVQDHLAKPLMVKDHTLKIHIVLEHMHPESSEEMMYKSLMKWSNAGDPDPNDLEERLLVVHICEANVSVFSVALEVVEFVAPVVNFLALADRICIEMASPSDVAKVLEVKRSFRPNNARKMPSWSKVVRFESVKSMKQHLEIRGETPLKSKWTTACPDRKSPAELSDDGSQAALQVSEPEVSTTARSSSSGTNEEAETEEAEKPGIEVSMDATAGPNSDDAASSSVDIPGEDLEELPQIDTDTSQAPTATVHQHKLALASTSQNKVDKVQDDLKDDVSKASDLTDLQNLNMDDLVTLDEVGDDVKDQEPEPHHSSSKRSSRGRRERQHSGDEKDSKGPSSSSLSTNKSSKSSDSTSGSPVKSKDSSEHSKPPSKPSSPSPRKSSSPSVVTETPSSKDKRTQRSRTKSPIKSSSTTSRPTRSSAATREKDTSKRTVEASVQSHPEQLSERGKDTGPKESQTVHEESFQILDSIDCEGEGQTETHSEMETEVSPPDQAADKSKKTVFKVVDSVDDNPVQERSGQRRSTRGKKGDDSKEASEKPDNGEEATYKILDSVEDEAASEKPAITTRSNRGLRERSKTDASTERSATEKMPTRGQTPSKESQDKDKTQNKKKESPPKESTSTKKSASVDKDLSEEVATFQVLDSVEDEIPKDDQPAPRGKGKRGRPKKQVKSTKKTNMVDMDAPQKAADEEEVTYQILDSVVEDSVSDHPPVDQSASSAEGIISRNVDPEKQNTGSLEETTKNEEETKTVYQIVDVVEDDQVQEELTATEESNIARTEISSTSKSPDKADEDLSEEVGTSQVLDSVEDEVPKDDQPAPRGKGKRGRPKKQVKSTKKTNMVDRDAPQKAADEEEVTCQIQDSVVEGSDNDHPPVDQSASSAEGIISRNVDPEEQNTGSLEETTENAEETKTVYQIVEAVEDDQVQEELTATEESNIVRTEISSTSKFPDKADEDLSEEVVTSKDLDSVEDEVPKDDQPAPRGKGKRGRPKKQVKSTKTTNMVDRDAPQKAADEEEVTCQIQDSVVEGSDNDHPPVDQSASSAEGIISRNVDQEEQNTESLEETTKNEEETKTVNQIVDVVEDDQVQEELTATEESNIARTEISSTSKSPEKANGKEDTPVSCTTVTEASEKVVVKKESPSMIVDDLKEVHEDPSVIEGSATTEKEKTPMTDNETKEVLSTSQSDTVILEKDSKEKSPEKELTTSTLNLDKVRDEEEDFPDDTAEEEELRKRKEAARENPLDKEQEVSQTRGSRGRGSSRGQGNRAGKSQERKKGKKEEKDLVDSQELVTLDEVGPDDVAEGVQDNQDKDGRIKEGDLPSLVTLDEIVEEQAEGQAEQSMPITQSVSQEDKSGNTSNQETLETLDEAGVAEEEKTDEKQTEKISGPMKRKHDDDKEDGENVLVVDKVEEADGEEEKEVLTPRKRGRAKRARQTPVRKSTRGKAVSTEDKREEEKKPTEELLPTLLPAASSSSVDKDSSSLSKDIKVEVQVTAEAEQDINSASAGPEPQQENKAQEECVEEKGVKEREERCQADVKVPTKRTSELHGSEAKRSRSQSPSVPADFKLPEFNPNCPLGQEFVVPKSGFFCNLCAVFYLNEKSAKELHCSSQKHYDNLKKYYQKNQQKSLRSSQGSIFE
ncbi:uncharacterized protein LOC121504720 [Cheilinus undulatus]|uniref:uncharacterized protein LOC121504720 n=1 Tax=Cheilinus undulatus TaxID=241271 RepID=UPI001BD49D4A|nr:uncharacterized protein LOC121504720 [Cheilinus undulatus]